MRRHSEITAEGKRITKLDQILLNGNNVALVRVLSAPYPADSHWLVHTHMWNRFSSSYM